ncbi:MAG: protein kinase [Thermoanaerobaculia bacterium]
MIGKRLCHYRITGQLGKGGMGEVYRAEDTRLRRQVALKVLPPDLGSDAERLERFQREAKALAALDHPHIVTIYSVEEADGVHFLTMQLVEGEQLAELIRRGGMSLRRIFEIAIPLADALAAAHEKGVVHRDLKPGNIMVTGAGQVKVLDFGLAKMQPRREDAVSSELVTEFMTRTDRVLGTVPYMSPEQLEGKKVDERTDIFSLGATLYEMATGERPFKGDSPPALMSEILKERPPPVTSRNQRLPRHFERIVDHCLEKAPSDRFQTARDVYNELRSLKAEVESVEQAPSSPATRAPAEGRRARKALAATLGTILLGVIALGFWVARPPPAHSPLEIQSLAVLPLGNMMNDPEQDYFVDGMTDAVITELSKIGALKVISRTSAMRYKNTDKSLPEIAADLGVDAVVDGSVLRSGDRVRITAQLIDASTDEHLWADNFDRDLGDILALHSDVARSIAARVEITLTPEQQARSVVTETVDPQAYEAHLKGEFYWNRFTPAGFQTALRYFQEAVTLDPGHAAAQAGVARAYTTLGALGVLPAREARATALAAASNAVELDDTLAIARISLGLARLIFEWDWASAERDLRRAIELSPSGSEPHYAYGVYLLRVGRLAESLAAMGRARELDPVSPRKNGGVAIVLYFSQKYELALQQAAVMKELDPTFAYAYWISGMSHERTGNHQEAIAELVELTALLPESSWALASLGYVYASAGKRDEARAVLERLREWSEQRYVMSTFFALVYLGLGEIDQVLDLLEQGYRDREPELSLFHVYPFAEAIEDEPRYRDLLRRMDFPG